LQNEGRSVMGREWSFFFLSRVALTQQEKVPLHLRLRACVLACPQSRLPQHSWLQVRSAPRSTAKKKFSQTSLTSAKSQPVPSSKVAGSRPEVIGKKAQGEKKKGGKPGKKEK
jgi:hypothetical protein